jgi:hypothetical protein
MANLFEPEFDAEQGRPGVSWRRARLGRQAGAERLGASLFELPPGQAAFPFHFHLANEELLIVIRGRPTLRTRAGERGLEFVSYPDTGKIFARDTPPGGDPVEIGGAFLRTDAIDYFEGEPEPE